MLEKLNKSFSARRLAPIVLPIIEKEPVNNLLQLPVKENRIQDCPTISVTCSDAGSGGNTPIKFKASVTGDIPRSEISYNWSVTKGTIRQGQGTAVIEVDVTGVYQERAICVFYREG
jgi:hypothetical protein